MALIKCPECGAEISDKATVCPKCGNLTNADGITVAEVKEEQQTNNFSPKKKKSLLKQAILMWPLLILEIILVLAPLVISSFADFTVPDKLPEYTIVAALVVNIILAARLSVKIWKELRVAVKEKKHIKKNTIALILSIGFLLFNCSYLYGGIFSKDSTIVGTWESDFLGSYSTRYVFDENGEFTSYVIENESGIKVPGGKGTYTVNNGEVVITMSGGSVINDEYEIDGDKLKLNGYTWKRVDQGDIAMVLLLMWISCSVFCYFIMRSKGYPNDKCWAHCIGGFLLGVIWLIVCLVKKPVERPMDLPPNSPGSERNYAIEQIGKLAQLRDSGAISITEYEEKKKELLKQIQEDVHGYRNLSGM